MSYPKKAQNNSKDIITKSKSGAVTSRLSEDKREKLLAIQQREQLKGLLANKFIEKYGKDKSINNDIVNKEVTSFMKNEKLTEGNLLLLEQKIKDLSSNPSKPILDSNDPKNEDATYNKSFKNTGSEFNQSVTQAKLRPADDDAISMASSQRPKSVYALGNEDDEWAIMLKYDTELYKKEKELEKIRDYEAKKRIKHELDRQIEDKKRLKVQEDRNIQVYTSMVSEQLKAQEIKEKKKEEDMRTKIFNEKLSRDKQLHEEYLRKKLEKKGEKEIEGVLVKSIKQEMEEETRTGAKKREEEREQLKKVLQENEINREKTFETARKLKEEDIHQQIITMKLMEKQEQDRIAEVKAREARSKKLMGMMEETIVKDQKIQIIEEEKKQLRHYQSKEAKEIEDEHNKKLKQNELKLEVRGYLDRQKNDKELKKKEEEEFNKKQADIWKKDTQDYVESEKKKMDTLKDINKKHQDVILLQMEEEKRKKQKKMNTEELLMNKPKLKIIAEKEQDIFQKAHVTAR